MEYKDYYKTLGVDKKATADQIKHAYRRLARKYHPDVSKEANAEEKFKNVQEAYEVLKDPEKRTAYDQLGSNWQAGQEFRPPPGWGGAKGHTRYYTSEDIGGFEGMGGFSEFFSNLFGSRATRGGEGFEGFQQRGQDQHAKVSITLQDAYHGATKTIHLQVPEIDANGRVQYKTRTLKINIPKGATEGQQLRLAGQGQSGMSGGPAGDLFLEILIESHSYFSLKGRDVYITLPITPWEAALGGEIRLPTLAGTVGLKLKPGSQSGQKMRLKGRGLPGATPGDQYAILQIFTPPAHSETERQYYEKMAQTMPFNPRKEWMI